MWPTKRDYIDMLEKLRVLTSAISVQYSVKIEKIDDIKADHNGGVINGHVSYPNDQTFPMVVVFHAMFIDGVSGRGRRLTLSVIAVPDRRVLMRTALRRPLDADGLSPQAWGP